MKVKKVNRKPFLFTFITSILFVISFSCCFVSGLLNPDVKVEETAEYVADIAKNHTKNGRYAALLVEPKENSNKKLIDSNLELYDLYGVFRQTIASFASTVNADHLFDVRFKDIETDNLSYLYVTSGMNSNPYKGHFKHEAYPIELMFNRVKDPDVWGKSGATSLMYISQSQADKFLDLENLEHTAENYKTLLKKKVYLTTNGEEKEWQIEDIYLEQNYFYEAVRECAGEFVFAWSLDAFNNGPQKQSMYFCSDYAFRNSYYFNYATSLYPLSDFDYKINNYNFINNYNIDASRLIFESESSSHVVSSVFLVLGIVLVITNLVFIYLNFGKLCWWHHVLFAASSFAPYLIFKLLFITVKRAMFFSAHSTKINLIMMISVAFVYSIVLIIRSKFKHEVDE